MSAWHGRGGLAPGGFLVGLTPSGRGARPGPDRELRTATGRMRIPSVYADGYEKAAVIDPALAAAYADHLWLGDPLADEAMAELQALSRQDSSRFLRAAIELQDDVLRGAPAGVLRFVEEVTAVPRWYDPAVARHGCRVFRWRK